MSTALPPSTASSSTAPTRVGWLPLVVIASAHLMAILDTTVMFVALPSVQRDLGMSAAARPWVVTAYTLAFAGLLLLGGRLADRLGARRTLLIGVLGFAVASAVGGAAVDGTMLIAARAVQGAFAALVVSSTKSLLVTVYREEKQQSSAIGIFTATLTAGAAVGLILGGALTSTLGWRWCLYVNVALSLIAIIAGPRVLPAVASRRETRIDYPSAVLATAGMVGLVFGLGQAADTGWNSATVVIPLIAAAALFGWFVARQARTPNPLLPLRVITDRNRGGAFIAFIVNSLSTFGMMLILTYQLQDVLHYTALLTGLALLPFALGAVLGAAVLAPKLTPHVAPRWLIAAGILLSAAGLVPLIALTPTTPYLPLILTATIIEGIGTGIGSSATLQTSLRGILPTDRGAAAAAGSAASQIGSSIGAALLNTIAVTATAGYLAARTHANVTVATVHGYTIAMAWGAALLLVAAVPAIIMVNAKRPAKATPSTR